MEKNGIIENLEAIRMLVRIALNSLNFMPLNTHGLKDFLCFLTSLFSPQVQLTRINCKGLTESAKFTSFLGMNLAPFNY